MTRVEKAKKIKADVKSGVEQVQVMMEKAIEDRNVDVNMAASMTQVTFLSQILISNAGVNDLLALMIESQEELNERLKNAAQGQKT